MCMYAILLHIQIFAAETRLYASVLSDKGLAQAYGLNKVVMLEQCWFSAKRIEERGRAQVAEEAPQSGAAAL
jgi:hypothetical protein